jgi:hypothetical protein
LIDNPRGLYRSETMASVGPCATVDYGTHTGMLTKRDYLIKGYEPPFHTLPTIEEYEAAKAQSAAGMKDA